MSYWNYRIVKDKNGWLSTAIRAKLGQDVGQSVQVVTEHKDKDAASDKRTYR